MARTQAARMDQQVTIQTNTPTTDALGGQSDSWATLATIWGEVVPLSGGEQFQAASVDSSLRFRLRIRQRSDVTPKMRVLWTPSWNSGLTQSTLQVLAVLPDGNAPREFQLLDLGESV